MASFAGVHFEERQTSGQYKRPVSAAVLVKTHYPGGNRNTTQNLGRAARTVSIVGLMTVAELNSMYTKVGEQGTLIWSWTSMTVVLETLTPSELLESGKHDVEMAFVEVT